MAKSWRASAIARVIRAVPVPKSRGNEFMLGGLRVAIKPTSSAAVAVCDDMLRHVTRVIGAFGNGGSTYDLWSLGRTTYRRVSSLDKRGCLVVGRRAFEKCGRWPRKVKLEVPFRGGPDEGGDPEPAPLD